MPMGGRQSCIDTARAVAHVPAIQKAGMHEAARIAQALLQREAMMAVIASAGSREDRARAERLPAPEKAAPAHHAPEERPGGGDHPRRQWAGRGDGEGHPSPEDEGPHHIDLTA